jgi:TldD protein
MQEVIDACLNAAGKRKAQYADIRVIERRRETLTVRDGSARDMTRSTELGLGVRVLHKGHWGFAASREVTAAEAAAITDQALRIAEASAGAGGEAIRWDDSTPAQAEWSTPIERDPFEVPLEEKLARLMAADQAMAEVLSRSRDTTHRSSFYDAWREDQHFGSSDGGRIHQVITECGGGIQAETIRGGDQQVRCFPNSFRGQFHTQGYEAFLRYDLVGEAPRVAQEALALLDCEAVPAGETTLILDGPQLALQIHESIGHAIELDRVLGWEAAYAGRSFVGLEDGGSLRYGSELMNVTCDPTLPGGLGSYAFDDDGLATFREDLIKDGTFLAFLSSRDTAPYTGKRSNACNRADGFARLPIVRMPNVNLEPGSMSLEEMISGVKEGYLFSNNRSWSIDDHRVNFQFGCESAYEIRDGRLTGKMLKNPNYTGITTEFWAGLSGVCGPELWNIWGTPNCGKGQPGQTAHVAHGCAPSRFERVRVGVRG